MITRWKEGIVNTGHEHIRLYHGDFDSMARLVALVAPPKENCFTVQFLMRADSDSEIINQILEDVRNELDFYLIEHPINDEADPWQYCIYHAGTTSNMYSKVHWDYYPETFIRDGLRRLTMKSEDYVNDLERCYEKIHQVVGSEIEPLESIKLVEQYREYFRPDKVRVILLAESHVRTTDMDRQILVPPFSSLPGYPEHYAKFVYCLAYGERELTKDENHPRRDGTPQFWKIFFSCLNLVTENREFAPVQITRTPCLEERIQNKIKILQDMKRRGIWLVDTSIVGLYKNQRQKVSKMREILNISWNNYTKRVVMDSHPDYVICIGKGLDKIVKEDLKVNIGENYFHILGQPQEQVSASQHMKNWRSYFETCSKFAPT